MIKLIKNLEGKTRTQRREIVVKELRDNDLEFMSDEYTSFLGRGHNIIIPSNKKSVIAIGSHFDAVDGSPGANDNGSAVAVTLELAKRLKNFDGEIGVAYFFFDQEEDGLIGSMKYLQNNKPQNIIGLYNMELVGLGKNIALWPIEPQDEGTLLQTFEKARYLQSSWIF